MTTDICRRPSDGAGLRARAATDAKRSRDLRRTLDLLLRRLLSGKVTLKGN
jgi:hypothetical protein